MSKSIEGLPKFKAPKEVWKAISDALDNQTGKSLQEGVEEVRQETLKAPDIWSDIEADLDDQPYQEFNRPVLKEAIDGLPLLKAPQLDLNNLTETDNPSFFRRNLSVISGIAASLSLIASVLFFTINLEGEEQETVSITYSEEVGEEDIDALTVIEDFEANTEDEVLTFIKENCTDLIARCEDPEFKGLLDHYIELEDARNHLLQEVKSNRHQVQLVNYLIEVEKEKTEIGKALIQSLMS